MWRLGRRVITDGLLAISLCASGPSLSAESEPGADRDRTTAAPVVFLEDVYPIFQRNCIACHGESAEGSLRLDARRYAAEGGHTGSPILGGDVSTNAILLRVTTSDASIRMPKGEPPLSDADAATLRRWVELGTPWTDPPSLRNAANVGGYEITWECLKPWDPREWSNERFLVVEWWFWRFGWAWIAVLLWIGLCDRARQWVQSNHPRVQLPRGRLWRRLASTSRSTHLAAILGLTAVALGIFYQQQARRADAEVDELRSDITRLNYALNPNAVPEGGLPSLKRPQHPPRLGGEYYRGNDERSEHLFNGGFYRTCTMRVWLCRADGTTLAWGDELDPRQCLIRFEIERAQGAAAALFAPEIMRNSYIATIPPGTTVTTPDAEIVPFHPEGEGLWIASVPVDLTPAATARQIGTFYICRGKLPNAGGTPSDPHYAARLDLRIDQGRVAVESELWLGCLFRTGNVQPVLEGKIADDEWFSFRPIPEIVGEQTTSDPRLLGTDAYRLELGAEAPTTGTSDIKAPLAPQTAR